MTFEYSFERYLQEAAEVLTDCKAYQFFQLFDSYGRGICFEDGMTAYPEEEVKEPITAIVDFDPARSCEKPLRITLENLRKDKRFDFPLGFVDPIHYIESRQLLASRSGGINLISACRYRLFITQTAAQKTAPG